MTKASNISGSSTASRVVRARPAGKNSKGQEAWVVILDSGQRRQVITSQSSSATMDDAVAVYSDALKRLAKR